MLTRNVVLISRLQLQDTKGISLKPILNENEEKRRETQTKLIKNGLDTKAGCQREKTTQLNFL